MANTNLTIDQITQDSLMVLHQKCSFIGSIVRDYDNQYANEGAKIGNSIRIRRPIEYTSATGATMTTGTGADSVGQKFDLTLSTQRHVPMRFTSNEMTFDIDRFRERHIEPAMAKLAAMMESDTFGNVDKIYNTVLAGTKCEFADVLNGRKKIVDHLAPMDGRSCQLDTQANVDMVNELKGLFHAQDEIKAQYRDGMMGHTGSFDFYENTILPTQVTGAEAGLTNYLVNGASQTSTDIDTGSLIVDTGTKTIKAGDVFTIANVYRVHPETKVTQTDLQQFVVLTAATGAGTLSVSPGLVSSGPRQNISAAPANNATLTFLGSASTTYNQSLVYQKGAFAFGSADIYLPKGTAMASRQAYDGISLRIVQDYAIVKDQLLTRCDVIYGSTPLYRQHAAKIWHT